ncbi:MAG: hypothetical protein JW702_09010 [Clostridiales bacterium]|nr:hypothetical protein [Clostridiales bacterium]
MRIVVRFEILYPQAIEFFLNRKLKEYKDLEKLDDYKVKARRLGKNHYFLEMDLFLESNGGGEKDI